MRFRQGPRMLSLLLMLVLAASACGNGGGETATDDETPTAGEETPAPADGDLVIGVSYPTADNVFWENYMAFIEDGGEQLGVEIRAVAAENNEQKQIADVENLIAQGIDGLILTPQSTAVARSLLRTANDAGVPVVVTDRFPEYEPGEDPDADYIGFIGPNDVQAGRGIVEALAEMGATGVLALGGLPGSSVAEGRQQGLEEGAEAAGVEIVQYQGVGESEDDGLQGAENMLQAHATGQADAFWCYNDSLCMGALQALRNAGREDEFLTGGMDLTPAAIEAIQEGRYDVSFGGHWLQGGFGLIMLYDSINGQEPEEPIVRLDLLRVDETNVDQFVEQYIDNPPEYDFQELSRAHNPDATGFFEITLD